MMNTNEETERLSGLKLICLLLVAFAFLCAVYALGIATQLVSFTSAAWLVGTEQAAVGPLVFVLYAVLYSRAAWDLHRFRRWGRWLAIFLLGWRLLQEVQAVSAAVIDTHVPQIARSGLTIIICAVVIRYLFQEHVRLAFEFANVNQKKKGPEIG